MALPTFTMRQLLESGVHFGHRTRRWNPKMAPYLFGIRNGIHIVDLQQTVPLLHRALQAIHEITVEGGRVLFVGTKRQASRMIADHAKRCGQYYVNHRWLGGMLTNWSTISISIRRLRELGDILGDEDSGLTKKELLALQRERFKLDRALGGIKELGGLPDILFVIDTLKEAIAVSEANKLGIPVAAVIDSNSDPDGITYPIPGNDDAMRAIELYCTLISDTVLDGIQKSLAASDGDVGELEEAPRERLPEDEAASGEGPVREEAVEEAEAPATEAVEAGPSEAGPSDAEPSEAELEEAGTVEPGPGDAAAAQATVPELPEAEVEEAAETAPGEITIAKTAAADGGKEEAKGPADKEVTAGKTVAKKRVARKKTSVRKKPTGKTTQKRTAGKRPAKAPAKATREKTTKEKEGSDKIAE